MDVPTEAQLLARVTLLGSLFALCTACAGRGDDASRVADSATRTPDTVAAPVAAADSRWTVDALGAGPVRVGMTLAEARAAVGPSITFADPKTKECDYVSPAGGPGGLIFMVVEGKIARVDVRDSAIATAAGAKVGDAADHIQMLYADRVRVSPHKYTSGKYLTVPHGTGADSVNQIVFETDSGGRVTVYRAGRLPEVGWIEGCS